MDIEMAADHEFYRQVWNSTLSNLLGWSEKQIAEWIDENLKSWEECYAVYVNQPPEYWVVDALIPERVREAIGAARTAKLRHDLVYAIEMSDLQWFRSPNYDWSAARSRVKDAIASYFM